MEVILSIDAGTTGVRSVLVDKQGSIVESSYQEFPQYFPQSGYVEHDPMEIWVAIEHTIRDVIERFGSQPVAIGITNQRETIVCWDKKSSIPQCNALVWQDRRTSKRCTQLLEDGVLPLVRESTGLVLDPYFSATKIEWLIENKIQLSEGIAFGTIDSWILWKLTDGAVYATDISNASRTMLFNIHDLCWDDDLLKIFGVSASNLPEVLPSSGHFGTTMNQSVLNAGIPITGIAGDQQASLFGQTGFAEGDAKNTYGTGSFVLLNTGNLCPDPVDGLLNTIAWSISENGKNSVTYALEGSIFSTGSTVQWLRDGLEIIKEASELESLALKCDSTGGLFLVPAFTGLGSPWWDPTARGTLIGITRGTGRSEIARAAIESMVFQTRDVVESMRRATGRSIKSLKVDGGASVMDLMLQLQAKHLQVNVSRPVSHETTALGAAYLAGLAHGFWKSLEEIASLWTVEFTACPTEITEIDEFAYQQWLLAVKRSLEWVI
ncbi:glycerol kinase [bacterium]|nr:glycerol kinase [bacterium]|tara:strand:+ start:38 stop:1516 length:1479 start_codon:yes stop_codon:yes gene_type:complete